MFNAYYVTMQAAQQTEVYWMALARDVPFSQFATNDLIRLAAGNLDRVGHLTIAELSKVA